VNSGYLLTKFAPYVAAEKLVYLRPIMPFEPNRRSRPPRKSRDPLRIAVIGSISPGKRQFDAVMAVAKARSAGASLHLSVIGPDTSKYAKDFKRMVTDLGEEGFEFTGEVSNATALLADCDVLINCSEDEGLGRVTIEALRQGVPVIGARSGATTELIEQSGGGFLYEPGDIDQLADLVRQLASHADELAIAADRGLEFASTRFALSPAINSFSDLVCVAGEAVRQ
jgi:glycosyltransferase involved in cell wall biosynthesis